MIAEKPEFTNLHQKTGALPALPGEDASKDNIVGLGDINGTIYDVITGKEEPITDHHQATRYFVRQNMPHPLSFVKKRLATVNYYGGLPADSESSPFDVLVYKNILEVHNEIVADVELTTAPSQEELEDLTEDFYDFLPDINEAEIINHFALVGKSSLFSAGTTDGSKEDFANGRFFYQYYFRIEDWESEEEAQENDGIYVESLVKRQPSEWGVTGETNENLYGVINRAGMLEILRSMYHPDGALYGLTDFQTKEPIRKFFKSIKFGIRF